MKHYVKTIKYTPKRGEKEARREIELLRIAGTHGFAPKLLAVEFKNGYEHVSEPIAQSLEDQPSTLNSVCEITMEKIQGQTLADKYGDDHREIPPGIWKQIHKILSILYESEGIEYIDITPYNFMESDGKIFIIDFGDAYYRGKEMNWFLKEFLDGDFSWNPDFA